MKKSLLPVILVFFVSAWSHAQVKYGFRLGLSSINLKQETIEQDGIRLAIQDASYGYHLGFFVRGKLGDRFYVQPEALFNSSRVDFQVDDFRQNLVGTVLTEKYRTMDVPVMIGYKLGPLRLEAGPTGHFYVASKSELEDELSGYTRRFNNLTLGYQAGVGLDLWKVLLDLRYEGNFTNFGDHMRIGGRKVPFSEAPSRLVLTAGLSF
ncbi:MAG: hypothetical protein RLY31_442 [Bacteroidota bacterium]|jgi:hypothetical protein